MNHELLAVLEYIEQERGISKEQLVNAVEKALAATCQKNLDRRAKNVEAKLNRSNGSIRVVAIYDVVDAIDTYVEKDREGKEKVKDKADEQITLQEAVQFDPSVKVGEQLRMEITPKDFGRIVAQTAKQAILQEIRKAEKQTIEDEFKDQVGEIVSGTVRRYEHGNIIVDLQKAEAMIPAREKVPSEQYMPGDRINVLLQKVDINAAGPSLIVSRASADFVSKLFEREVSEMHDGIVRIVACVREPGKRTKIAVASSDPRVDPVGACVGVRGTRVRRVTDEFDSEKIYIIPYDEDIRKYAANALAPAKVQNVEVNEEKHELLITVAGEQQSKLAFGRRAQNVRLSAKLIGWKISLKSSDASAANGPSISEQLAAAAGKLAEELGVSNKTAQKLVDNGFVTIDGVLAADPAALAAIDGIDADEITAARERLANE